MSSEIYVSPIVRRQQMIQKLEEERQRQRIKREKMLNDLDYIRDQLRDAQKRAEKTNIKSEKEIVHLSNLANKMSDREELSGANLALTLPQEVANNFFGQVNRIESSWSSKPELAEDSVEELERRKLVRYANEISLSLQGAVTETVQEREIRDNFVAYLNKLLSDGDLGFNDFKSFIDQRYEQLKSMLEIVVPESDEDPLYDYYALCDLLDMKAEPVRRSNLHRRIQELTQMYQMRVDRDFVYENLKEVYAELNMEIAGEAVLDGLNGFWVNDKDIENCDIFMFMDRDRNNYLFETVAKIPETKTLTEDMKNGYVESAHKICTKYDQVIEKMKERGIDFKVEGRTEPAVFHAMRQVAVSGSSKDAPSRGMGRDNIKEMSLDQ